VSWSALKREAQTGGPPWAGVPRPGQRPLVIARRLLAGTIGDLAYGFAWIEGAGLRVVSACGTRRYWYADRGMDFVKAREQAAWALRKAGGMACARGWTHRAKWRTTADGDGAVESYWLKDGLRVQGERIYHHASGRLVVAAETQAEAFLLAERALALWDRWEIKDTSELLETMGDAKRRQLAGLRLAAIKRLSQIEPPRAAEERNDGQTEETDEQLAA
jgi:hypothetical protein